MRKKINVFWFRRDLRLFDNHGLFKALSEEIPVLPLFIFDTEILKEFPDPYDRRVSFIYDQLLQINAVLKKSGSSILIKHGTPEHIFTQLSEKYEINTVFSNFDHEPSSISRDERVGDLLKKFGCEFQQFKDHVVYDKNEILNMSGNTYAVYTPFMRRWKEQLTDEHLQHFPSEKHLYNCINEQFDFLPLLETGYHKLPDEIPNFIFNEKLIKDYHLTRDFPGIRGTSEIGIHLRFGTISVRQAVKEAARLSEVWFNELIWREFFIQIMWNFPHVALGAFKKKYDLVEWRNNEDEFEQWCNGNTGFPIVDAGMRELVQTGKMHNRVRMITANFLTKLLLIDWQWGERFFAQHLLDFEYSSNNGNWQWAAGTGADAAPYFRIFNPKTQMEKFDPDLSYCKTWLSQAEIKSPEPVVDYAFARKRCLQVFGSLKTDI